MYNEVGFYVDQEKNSPWLNSFNHHKTINIILINNESQNVTKINKTSTYVVQRMFKNRSFECSK